MSNFLQFQIYAFEVAHFLRQMIAVQPQLIFVSGGSAPQYRRDTGKMHLLSDDDFIDELKNYNGTPPAVTRSTFYSI